MLKRLCPGIGPQRILRFWLLGPRLNSTWPGRGFGARRSKRPRAAASGAGPPCEGEPGPPRGEGGGMHGTRGTSGGVRARGPGLSPVVQPPARPLFTINGNNSLQALLTGADEPR